MTTGREIAAIQPRNLEETITLGKVLAASGYFTDTKDAAQAVVKIMAGAELGLGPIASMRGVYIVKGQTSFAAALIATLIKRSGKYDYRVSVHSDEECTIDFYEHGQIVGSSNFDIDDAKAAGLAATDNYRKFPRNMLWARAMSNGAKWYCADIFGGPIYTPDELGAAVDGETGSVIALPESGSSPAPQAEAPTGQGGLAIEAQVKAMYIIAGREHHKTKEQTEEACQRIYSVYPAQLTRWQGIEFIDRLKAGTVWTEPEPPKPAPPTTGAVEIPAFADGRAMLTWCHKQTGVSGKEMLGALSANDVSQVGDLRKAAEIILGAFGSKTGQQISVDRDNADLYGEKQP